MMMNAYLRSVYGMIAFLCTSANLFAQPKDADKARETMLKATKFMVEEVSTHGGYVGIYYKDLSRRWGELEAFNTMIWIQEPGTLNMGNLFLTAYEVTADEYYYQAAVKVAEALIWGQLPVGGWNYMIDFAGDRSLKEWYRTIGKNAWGFEEHNQYYGNATFDDVTTSSAAKFLLRIYLVKQDPTFKPALDKAINFMLTAQYPLGGWPQRYPLMSNHPHGNLEDYTSYYTFNDDVIWGNLSFLMDCYATLGEERLLDPIRRAMNFYLLSQQGSPQGGWTEQYDMELKPAHARTYEPASLMPGVTFNNAMLLMKFYEYTGDRRYISRIPDAIAWLESCLLPEDQTENGTKTHPTFVEVGTNKAIYAHRKGNGVGNGVYWIDYDDHNLLAHYGGKGKIDIQLLKDTFARLEKADPKEISKNSPLSSGKFEGKGNPQQYFDLLNSNLLGNPSSDEVRVIMDGLDSEGRWLTKHEWISRPYSVSAEGEEANTARNSDANGNAIRDSSEQEYITVRAYIQNMQTLLGYIDHQN